MPWTVVFTLHEAKNLKDVQFIGKQDPYVVVNLGK